MKRNITLLALILAISMLTGCSNDTKSPVKSTENINSEEIKSETIETTEKANEIIPIIDKEIICASFVTHDYPVPEKVIRIESMEEWEKYEFSNSLSWPEIENAFPDNIIYILQGESPTGSIKLQISEATISEAILNVKVEAIYPEIGTDDMAGCFFIFICDKNVKDIKINETN